MQFIVKNRHTIYRCPVCGLKRTDLRQNYEEFVATHYSRGYYTGDPRYSAYANYKDDKKVILRNLRKFLTRIKKHKKEGKLLDVGCAMGFFVELALSHGFDAYGVDASQYAVTQAQKVNGGHRIALGTIGSVTYRPKSFDVISLFDVFEHLGDPQRDLRRLRTFLKDDGIMIIATGDTQSLAARLLGRRWTFYIPPQHLFFFNRDNLTRVLKDEGLVPVEWFRIGKWLSLRYVLHLARTTGESVVAAWLYDLTQRVKLGRVPLFVPLGDNMVVIARKSDTQP